MTFQKSPFPTDLFSPTANCAKIMKIHISARTWREFSPYLLWKNKASGRRAVKFACVNRIFPFPQNLQQLQKSENRLLIYNLLGCSVCWPINLILANILVAAISCLQLQLHLILLPLLLLLSPFFFCEDNEIKRKFSSSHTFHAASTKGSNEAQDRKRRQRKAIYGKHAAFRSKAKTTTMRTRTTTIAICQRGKILGGQRCYTTQNTSLSIKFLKWNFKSLKGSSAGKKIHAGGKSQEEFAMRLLYLAVAAAAAATCNGNGNNSCCCCCCPVALSKMLEVGATSALFCALFLYIFFPAFSVLFVFFWIFFMYTPSQTA